MIPASYIQSRSIAWGTFSESPWRVTSAIIYNQHGKCNNTLNMKRTVRVKTWDEYTVCECQYFKTCDSWNRQLHCIGYFGFDRYSDWTIAHLTKTPYGLWGQRELKMSYYLWKVILTLFDIKFKLASKEIPNSWPTKSHQLRRIVGNKKVRCVPGRIDSVRVGNKRLHRWSLLKAARAVVKRRRYFLLSLKR